MVTGGRVRATVIGDTTLDVTVLGARPLPGSDQPARIQAGPGGQGANVAVRLARGGADVCLVTVIGTDTAGRELEAHLAAEGIAVVNLPARRSGIVVSLVDGTGERAMVSDRASFDEAGLASGPVRAALDDAEWIHVSGYPLADPGSGAPLAAILAARQEGLRCSIGGGSFRPGSDIADRLRTARPDLVLFDREEAAAVLDLDEAPGSDLAAPALAASLVARFHAPAIVTDGGAGAAAATEDGSCAASRPRRSVVDATGAGDAHAAAMILALARGLWPPTLEAVCQALEVAADIGAEVTDAVGAQAAIPAESRP